MTSCTTASVTLTQFVSSLNSHSYHKAPKVYTYSALISHNLTTEQIGTRLCVNPSVPVPTVGRLRGIAEDFGLDLTQEELNDVTECVSGFIKTNYDCIYRMPEPKPPVKYPRTPGYRPSPEENPLNAWYMKTDIPGATTGKLSGKKVAIKDNVCIAGVPMMNGSKLIEGYTPEFDATVVTRILEAGHIVGKAACEHFCLSANSFTCDTGPVLNPVDKSRSTGGSSSGSGALVASGEVDIAVGGDQGGSVRIPSSWCGIVGLKPTHGLVPYTGAIPIEPTVDHLGPMARTVPDCALLLEVLAGVDGMDDRQKLNVDVPEYSKQLKSDLTGIKVGLVKEGFAKCQPGVSATVRTAAESMVKAGASVSDVSIPLHTHGEAIWFPVCLEGGYATMIERAAGGPSSKGFHSVTLMDHQRRALATNPNSMSRPLKLATIFGKYMQEETNYHFYGRGSNLVMALTAAYDAALKDFDVIIMPTMPYTAPKLPTEEQRLTDVVSECFGMICNTAPFNATGHPALSINAGNLEGLPVGMMIIGKKYHEQDVLNAAYGFECVRDSK